MRSQNSRPVRVPNGLSAAAIMGWSSTAMEARYQHVTGGILADVAQRVGGLIREVANDAEDSGAEGSEESR